MSGKITILLLILLFAAESIWAQKTLIVDKVGRGKHLEYNTDDFITFFSGDPEFKTAGTISAISDSTITINGAFTVSLSKISKIQRTHQFLYGSKYYLFGAAAVYPAISAVNHALNDENLTDRSMITFPATLISAGVLSRLFQFRNIKLGKKWKLKVVEFESLQQTKH